MIWSPQQEQALKAVSKWLNSTCSPQVFRLFGYAGTGKTTLINEITSYINKPVLYMAFTGKAALVMRKKGCTGASTIHSAIYRPVEDKNTGKVEFVLNRDSEVSNAGLVIVDEISMVNAELGQDLLQYGTKILVLGDPFQLPPVGGDGFFTSDAPDIMLTEIHRQAQDNPIIRMSMDIRERRSIRGQSYGESKVFSRRLIDDPRFDKILLESDQIICGLNRTRVSLNTRVRLLKGIADPENVFKPQEKDKLVCIRNNRKKGLLNGGLWTIDSIEGKSLYEMEVTSLDDPNLMYVDVSVPHQFFEGTESELDWRSRKRIDEFTFGDVLTAHKSQGSQWDTVVVIDESGAFKEHADRHLYTAVTRAAEKVYVAI